MELFGNNDFSVSIHATRYSKLRNCNYPGTTSKSYSNNHLQSAKFEQVLPSTHLNTQKRYTKKHRKKYTVKCTTMYTIVYKETQKFSSLVVSDPAAGHMFMLVLCRLVFSPSDIKITFSFHLLVENLYFFFHQSLPFLIYFVPLLLSFF